MSQFLSLSIASFKVPISKASNPLKDCAFSYLKLTYVVLGLKGSICDTFRGCNRHE